MHETEKPQFPEILPVIKEYLEKQKAAGEPMRIHLWDTNHSIDLPKRVVSDESLHKLIKEYGSPLYIIEDFAAKAAQKKADTFVQENHSKPSYILQRENGFANNMGYNDIIQIYKHVADDYRSDNKNKTRVIFPDPRQEIIHKEFTEEELRLMRKYNNVGNSYSQINSTENPIIRTAKKIVHNIKYKIVDSISLQEALSVRRLSDKYHGITMGGENLDQTLIDKEIERRVNTIFDPKRDVQVTFYGLLHFTKENDLSEGMLGLSIAVVDSNDMKEVRGIYKNFSKTHHQFPDYAYYADQNRMVKMDNDKAKAEFLGISEKEFKVWEIRRKLNNTTELPYTNEIATEPQPLLPRKVANRDTTPHYM